MVTLLWTGARSLRPASFAPRAARLAAGRRHDLAREPRRVPWRIWCTPVDASPNILVVLTDQLRYPPVYQSPELAQFCREQMPGQESLRDEGVSFTRHYPMSAACAPSRASLLTGQYPSLHGVTQTDGLAKGPEGPDMFWLAPDTVPTLGDWFCSPGYRTYIKGEERRAGERV